MGAKIQTTYSDEFKACALALVDSVGGRGHVKRVAQRLNVPPRTLAEWWSGRVNNAVATIRKDKRDEIVGGLQEFALKALTSMSAKQDRLDNAPLNHLAVALGISVDKLQLLIGAATSRTETFDRGVYSNLRAVGVEDAVIIEEDGDAD